MPNEGLFVGSQECKQTNVLHRGHKYSAAVCYSLDLSFVEKSKFGTIILLLLLLLKHTVVQASVILHEAQFEIYPSAS